MLRLKFDVRKKLGRAALAFGVAATLAATALVPDTAHANAYPSRTVRIIVPYGAGGIADVVMRMVAEKLSDKLGQPFIIENRPGAAGIVGIKAVMSAAPDGYTLTMIGGGLTAAKAVFKSLPYDIERDLIPISTTAFYSVVAATKAGSPYTSMKELIATAKAKPGHLNFGSINPGSNQHLAGELFKSMAGIQVTAIPFKTTPEAVTAMIRGDIDVLFEYQAGLQGALNDRQLVAIATTGRERAAALPDVPTVAESGLPDFDVTSWNALAAPAGTPTEIITLLSKAVNEVLALPEIQAATARYGMEARGSTSEELRERIAREVVQWGKVVEAANIPRK